MRLLVIIAIAFALFASCNQTSTREKMLEIKVDSLQEQLKNTYKPGLGEFMLAIQMHHAKLWYAGQAQNWPLANFEIEEIEETIGDARQFCADRPEIKSIDMIIAPIDSIKESIQTKDKKLFTSSFTLLTNTCNSCHVAVKHEFNVIKIPDVSPIGNQKF